MIHEFLDRPVVVVRMIPAVPSFPELALRASSRVSGCLLRHRVYAGAQRAGLHGDARFGGDNLACVFYLEAKPLRVHTGSPAATSPRYIQGVKSLQ